MDQKDFPSDGTFKEQRDYINLLQAGHDEKLTPVINSIVNSPFAVTCGDVPTGVNVKVFYHEVKPANETPNPAESNTGSKSIETVVRRELEVSPKSKREAITLHALEDGKTFSFNFKNGSLCTSTVAADKPFSERTAGLETPGIVISATDKSNGNRMFTMSNQNKDDEKNNANKGSSAVAPSKSFNP